MRQQDSELRIYEALNQTETPMKKPELKMYFKTILSVLATLVALEVTAHAQESVYRITEIGIPVEQRLFVEGDKVYGTATSPNAWAPRPFVWTQETGVTELGTSMGYISAVDKGQVVGTSLSPDSWLGYRRTAFSWTKTTGMVDLGTLGALWSEGYAVSDGMAAGILAHPLNYPGASNVFVYTKKRGMKDLGVTAWNRLPFIRDGVVCGTAYTAGLVRPFIYDDQCGLQLLPTLGGSSYAEGFSDGMVVGRSWVQELGSFRAFLYKAETGIRDLGTLPGMTGSWATGVDKGIVVGYSFGSGSGRAFVWTAEKGMVEIGMPTGGRYSWAWKIDSGLVAGSWYDNNTYKSFVWTEKDGFTDLGACYMEAIKGRHIIGQKYPENRAFIWNQRDGMIDLHPPGWINSYAVDLDFDHPGSPPISFVDPAAARVPFTKTRMVRVVGYGRNSAGQDSAFFAERTVPVE